jgi:hypothetical protein
MNPYLLHRRKAFRQTGDPFWANVVFLQNFQGTNGSKPATEQGPLALPITWNGDAVISTAQSPFAGGSSLALDGTGDSIQSPDSEAFNLSGDFTAEFWLYPSANPSVVYLLGQTVANTYAPVLPFVASGGLGIAASATGSSWFINNFATGAPSLALSTWVYIAFTRSGNSWRCWIGVSGATTQYLIGTGTYSGTPYNSTLPLILGGANSLYYFQGYIGPVRITKGVARNVSIVPTAPFPTGP